MPVWAIGTDKEWCETTYSHSDMAPGWPLYSCRLSAGHEGRHDCPVDFDHRTRPLPLSPRDEKTAAARRVVGR